MRDKANIFALPVLNDECALYSSIRARNSVLHCKTSSASCNKYGITIG